MKIKSYRLSSFFIICILLFSNTRLVHADYSNSGSYFKELLEKSDLIVTGITTGVIWYEEKKQILFEVSNVLSGILETKNILIDVVPSKKFCYETTDYLNHDQKCVLFLKNDNNKWIVMNAFDGVFSIEDYNDIKEILQEYRKNNLLFSEENKGEIISIFKKLESERIKIKLLIDIGEIISEEDTVFLNYLLDSQSKENIIFSLYYIAKYKLSSVSEKIKEIFYKSNDSDINYYISFALNKINENIK